MSQWDLQANETSVYFKNYVNDEVVEAVQKKFMEGYDTIYVSFDVMGRTFHEQLSYQLSLRLRALYGPKVNIEVGYNYQCVIKWVTNLGQVAVKELTTGAGCDVSDLISRSELIENFRKCYSGHLGMENSDACMTFHGICNVINNTPAAYDVDRVVERLNRETIGSSIKNH